MGTILVENIGGWVYFPFPDRTSPSLLRSSSLREGGVQSRNPAKNVGKSRYPANIFWPIPPSRQKLPQSRILVQMFFRSVWQSYCSGPEKDGMSAQKITKKKTVQGYISPFWRGTVGHFYFFI